MGSDLKKLDVKEIFLLAHEVNSLFALRQKHEDYLEKKMKVFCPNIISIAGVPIGAKLLELAGSLKRLAILPSSTIQLLGAEKALFRHIRTGAKSPKHGVIIQHHLLAQTQKKNRGKMARALADKIAIAAKIDYFKGEFQGNKLKKQLDIAFKRINKK